MNNLYVFKFRKVIWLKIVLVLWVWPSLIPWLDFQCKSLIFRTSHMKLCHVLYSYSFRRLLKLFPTFAFFATSFLLFADLNSGISISVSFLFFLLSFHPPFLSNFHLCWLHYFTCSCSPSFIFALSFCNPLKMPSFKQFSFSFPPNIIFKDRRVSFRSSDWWYVFFVIHHLFHGAPWHFFFLFRFWEKFECVSFYKNLKWIKIETILIKHRN